MADLSTLTREQLQERKQLLIRKQQLQIKAGVKFPTQEEVVPTIKRKFLEAFVPDAAEKMSFVQKRILPTEQLRSFTRGVIGGPELERGERTIIGQLERPSGAVRGSIFAGDLPFIDLFPGLKFKKKGVVEEAVKGFKVPEEVPEFEEIGRGISQIGGIISPKLREERLGGKTILEIAGAGADIITDPVQMLLFALGSPRVRSVLSRVAKGKFGIPGRGILRGKIAKARGLEKAKIRDIKAPLGTRVGEKIGLTKQAKKEQIKQITTKADEVIANTTESIEKNSKLLQRQLRTTTENKALFVQREAPKFFKRNSDGYRKTLEAISDDLASKGEQLTSVEMTNVIDDAIGKANELGIQDNATIRLLNKMREKYFARGADEAISFIEATNDLKNVQATVTAGARVGRARFTVDDLVANNFRGNFGELVAQRSDKFARLQAEYRPVIEAMNETQRIFQPSGGILKSGRGARFLETTAKKTAEGRLSQAEAELFKRLEEGSTFGKGIGDISSESNKLARELIDIKNQINRNRQLFEEASRAGQAQVSSRFDQRIAQLEARRNRIDTLLRKKEIDLRKIAEQVKSGGIFKRTGRFVVNVGKVLAIIETIRLLRRLGQGSGEFVSSNPEQ